MAIYPGATWEPVSGHTDGPFLRQILGVVLHVNDGSPSTADSNNDLHNYIQSSFGSGAVSCHFQVGKGGKVFQYIDTGQTAWCQGNGNAQYLSIESQGLAGEPATPQQVQAIGELLRWLNDTHGIPLQLADKPGQQGFGWHGMGAANGANWGHASCPGVRKDQRSQMLMIAGALSPSGGGTPIGGNVQQLTPEDLVALNGVFINALRSPEFETVILEKVWECVLQVPGIGQDKAGNLIGSIRSALGDIENKQVALATAIAGLQIPAAPSAAPIHYTVTLTGKADPA